MDKLATLLEKSVESVGAALFNTPNELVLKAILQGLDSISPFLFIKLSVFVLVEVLCYNQVSASHIPISIKVVRYVGNLLFLSLLKQIRSGFDHVRFSCR